MCANLFRNEMWNCVGGGMRHVYFVSETAKKWTISRPDAHHVPTPPDAGRLLCCVCHFNIHYAFDIIQIYTPRRRRPLRRNAARTPGPANALTALSARVTPGGNKHHHRYPPWCPPRPAPPPCGTTRKDPKCVCDTFTARRLSTTM